ncbi:hypothetical protein GCM10009847_22630 [Leucobacter tardus]|uniref:Cytochrome P450 n=1 Tax=Leucobacter tardus TaxID=501483 RepID=A0A939TN73_9MICO|nr:cytochrome P450 [Leucobacter tardus]MBO2990223.1 cytochrome P450 [Leucobacter tardus]
MSTEAPIADWVTIPDLYRDPFPIYERLRAEGGVHWVPSVNRYLVTSYAAVHATELDQVVYSADEEDSLQIRAMGHSMLRRDDPEHYLERKAWQPALRPGAVQRVWKAKFQRNAERYLDELIVKGPGADLVWDFAAPFAAESLRELIGLHNATQEDLQRWSQTMIDATGNYADDPEVWALGKQSFDEVDVALDEMLAWHAANPNESLLSQLLQIPDYRMPLERIRANVKMTIGGGLNEPRDALGVAAWGLLSHPEQRAAVETDPALWNAAFDETIRWVAPIGLYSRQVKHDTVLAGVRLPAGARLGICILSANRDEQVWDEPDRFDVRREAKPHLAFGKGVHVCLGAWAARAEVAEVALPLLFSSLEGLALIDEDPPEIGGWVFRGMTKLPITWTGRRSTPIGEPTGQTSPAPRIAVVGSGPSGCFSAQALKRTFPEAPIEVFDELPTPYGLVRYGVAADHQGTKAVARQFDRLFSAEGVRFRGNVRLGTDVTLRELEDAYDVVVLATGLHADAQLQIPGAERGRVRGAGEVTRFLNGYPDAPEPEPLGERVVVVGHGNVAMDLARIIARDAAGFVGSDIDDAAHHRFTERVRTIHLLGRSAPADAKFDPVMVRELAGLSGVAHRVHGAGALPDDGRDARIDAVRALAESDLPESRVTIHWWFGATPAVIMGTGAGTDAVTAVEVRGADGEELLPADDVITAIGFAGDVDAARELQPGAHPDGRIAAGLYTAGWLRRGPRGTIPDQRTDARELAQKVVADLRSGAVTTTAPGLPALETEIDFEGWRRIDLRERLTAAPGRERSKLRSRAAQLEAAADATLELPPLPSADGEALDPGIGTTVLFGTESGGAELVAEDLRQLFSDDTDVEVRDLGETGIDDLDPDRLYLLVCATYGDGEVPTSARPFVAQLLAERPDLSELRFAVFGMGDRSYDRTYSRGSELITEALRACGARQIGEYGRHDAGGPIPATEAARDWATGVCAALPSPARG